MSEQKTILITGATGYIGRHLTLLASTRGHIVKTLSRSNWNQGPCIPADRRYFGSLPEQIPLKAFELTQVVVHCAAWTRPGASLATAINVHGTIRLADLSLQLGVGTFIFLSSQSSRPDALSDYGRSKYEAEQALLSRFSNTNLNIVILRPGLVTGPGHGGLFQRLCKMIDAWPILPLLGGGKSVVQPIHIDDLCNAIFRCERIAGQINGKILKLGDPHGTPLVELLQALSLSRRGYRKLTITIPILPIAAMVRAAELMGLALPITTENLKGLKQIDKMDSAADMDLVGVPTRSLEVILRDNLEYDQTHLREAVLIARYLLGVSLSHELQVRYATAIERLQVHLDQEEQRLWRFVERYPKTLRMIDGGLAFLKPQGGIRRKIYTMFAILETCPEYSDEFLPKTCTLLGLFRFAAIGLRAGLAAGLGLILIQITKARSH